MEFYQPQLKRIEVLLKKSGLSRYRLCRELGLAESTLMRWINGTHKPSVIMVKFLRTSPVLKELENVFKIKNK